MIRRRSYFILCLCLSSFKLLFLKSYVSTDFDVHRNWMAITYNLDLKDWYFDSTSEWTLDYPPLFAIFELFLAFFAHALSLPGALELSAAPIRTESVIIYQKVTVIVSDLVYYYAVYKLCKSLQTLLASPAVDTTSGEKPQPGPPQQQSQPDSNKARANKVQVMARVKSKTTSQNHVEQSLADAIYRPDATSAIALLLLLQPGLLLVDHIHFQYNGFLSGVLLLSVANILEAKYVAGSFWFAVLLNMKHIYLYCAPAYGTYLLAGYCLAKVNGQSRVWTFIVRAGRLGSVVAAVFLITYAPFSDLETLGQIVKRLFPFKRGLTHAYWAPNAWSIYNTADKILATVFKDSLRVNFDLESITKRRTMIKSTSGLVGEFEHQYLPVVRPVATFVLVGLFVVPIVIKFLVRLNRRSPRLFMKGLTLTTFVSFMFGWHVHEKAIILVLLPMVPISFTDPHLRPAFLRLTLAGTYSLFPLLYQPAEYPVKLFLLAAYYYYARSQRPPANKSTSKLAQQAQISLLGTCYNLMDIGYLILIILSETYSTFLFGKLNYAWNPLAPLNRLAFLPLMMTSTLAAAGVSASFIELYSDFLTCSDETVAKL